MLTGWQISSLLFPIISLSNALIGESVPVSKFPVTDHSLAQLNLAATSVDPGVARHFLFCGTKLIRARRPQDPADDEAAALAMVVRTGFNTTKGALVRSMLFPKPSGFKFYQDSFRYISVMAAIAAIGFIVSFVNFIRLEVRFPSSLFMVVFNVFSRLSGTPSLSGHLILLPLSCHPLYLRHLLLASTSQYPGSRHSRYSV